MSAHPKVVVATPNVDGFFTPREFLGVRKTLGASIDLLEHPVGMIHFLPQDLILEIVVVVEAFFWKNYTFLIGTAFQKQIVYSILLIIYLFM